MRKIFCQQRCQLRAVVKIVVKNRNNKFRGKKELEDMSSKIKLRPYHPDDYAQVVKIYQNGIKEVNTNVYQSFYNGLFPQLIFCELLAFSVGSMVGLHCFNSNPLEAIIYGVISLLLFCSLSLWIRFTWTKNYIE